MRRNRSVLIICAVLHSCVFFIRPTDQFQPKPFLCWKLGADVHDQIIGKLKDKCLDRSRLHMGFFDKLKEAFENDPNDLDPIVGEENYKGSSSTSPVQRTQVQQQWIDLQQQQQARFAPTGKKIKSNAPIPATSLIGTTWSLELFLAGIPDRDPTNNLYGSRVNISSRDRQLGLGVICPEEPSIVIRIEFGEDGACRAQESEFTSGRNGEYKVQENGNMIRFSIDTTGLTRTVQTTGTITKIFWSDSDEVRTQTSSSYSIPPGFVYADSIIRYGSIPGTYDMDEGILCAEQTSGLFGVSSKMIPCGKFRARMINEE